MAMLRQVVVKRAGMSTSGDEEVDVSEVEEGLVVEGAVTTL